MRLAAAFFGMCVLLTMSTLTHAKYFYQRANCRLLFACVACPFATTQISSVSRSSLGSTTSSTSSLWLAAVQADQVACRLVGDGVRVLLPLAKVAAAVIDGELRRCIVRW